MFILVTEDDEPDDDGIDELVLESLPLPPQAFNITESPNTIPNPRMIRNTFLVQYFTSGILCRTFTKVNNKLICDYISIDTYP